MGNKRSFIRVIKMTAIYLQRTLGIITTDRISLLSESKTNGQNYGIVQPSDVSRSE